MLDQYIDFVNEINRYDGLRYSGLCECCGNRRAIDPDDALLICEECENDLKKALTSAE